MTTATNHSDLLARLGACADARDWYDGRESKAAWLACERGDWLLWVAAKLGVDHRLVVFAAAYAARAATQRQHADLVRTRIPWELVEQLLLEQPAEKGGGE